MTSPRQRIDKLRDEAIRLRHRLADAESAVLLARAAVARLELDIAAARQAAEAEASSDRRSDADG